MKDAVFALIDQERVRQENSLAMIPSENWTSKAVREAVGSVLINKYAEGQVGARYYQGNGVVDEVEGLCKRRALQAFGLDGREWGVNVQAHSGSPANLAVYNALLNPGDKILSMFLPDGGHLSHGWELPERKISIVSKIFQVDQYKTDPKSKLFDYAELEKQAKKFKPKLIISGGTAYPREINHKRMREIADSVGAYYLADIAHEAGLVAAGVMKSPFPFADVVTLTTHKTLRGPRGALIFASRELMEKINFSVFPGMQGGPHLHTIAGIAVALDEVIKSEFKAYAQQVVVNAQTLAEDLIKLGFEVVSGGTDKHLVLVDLRSKNLSGWVMAWALEVVGIVANRNTVPGETASPFYPSGLRLGTPAITTRGMKEAQMHEIARVIGKVYEVVADEQLPDKAKERKGWTAEFISRIFKEPKLLELHKSVKALCERFPLPE